MERADRINMAFQFLRGRGKAHSQKDVAEAMGASKPNVSSALKGDPKVLTDKFLQRFNAAFDNIFSVDWLLTGEGDMLQSETRNEVEYLTAEEIAEFDKARGEGRVTYIPLVNIDSVGGIHSPNALSSSEQYIERMIPFPDARPGDVAILQSGNSMSPTIPAGAIMQIRRVDGWREYFGYGSDFVLWLSDDRRITKQVIKYLPDPVNYVTCHSYNPESADEELPKSMIKEVWKIINVLINKGW